MLKNDLTINLRTRIEEYESLIEDYDKKHKKLNDIEKAERLEELIIKVELVIVVVQKVIRSLNDMIDNSGCSTMIKYEVDRSLTELREMLKSYTNNAFGYTDVLRSLRLRIENQLQLNKNTIN